MIRVFILIISIYLTQSLAQNKKFGPVLASSLTTIALCLFIYLIQPLYQIDQIEIFPIIYSGSFIGMTSEKVLKRSELLYSCIPFYFYYFIITQSFSGIGGSLGFSAFLSVTSIYIVKLTYTKLISRSFS